MTKEERILDDRIIKAGKAKELIDHPAWQEIHAKIEAETLKKLKAVDDKDAESIRVCKQVLMVNDKYKDWLYRTFQDGELAKQTFAKSGLKRTRI